jgi:intracellular multiplication protein IcmG
MVDNEKYDDEYEFIDPETGSADAMDYTPEASSQSSGEKSSVDKTFAGKSGVIRNVLIVVVLVIVVMVIYPFVHSSLLSPKKASIITTVTPESREQVYIAPITPTPVSAPLPDVSASTNVDEKVTQKLADLESSQERMQTEVVSSNSQLSGINNNINEMMTKITELNRTTVMYAAKVDEQSRAIEQLIAEAAALKKARAPHPVRHKVTAPSLKYYIQAVIPGRAWLIATNGSTLTVREGTVIAGLGMVKLIDPRQGRVVISSGRVIRFSQEDS